MTAKQVAELLKPLIENVNIDFSTLNERFDLTQSQSEEQILSFDDTYKAVSIVSSDFTRDEIALIISLNEWCEKFDINPREIVSELSLLKENSKQEEATVSSEELPEITNEEIMEIGNKLMKCVDILDEQKINLIDDFEKFVSIVENNLTKRELAISNCHLLRITMLSEIENLLNN